MFIREAFDSDYEAVMSVERAAFGSDEEAGLVADLLVDPSARPIVSLLAFEGDRVVGHILFTKAGLVSDDPLMRHRYACDESESICLDEVI